MNLNTSAALLSLSQYGHHIDTSSVSIINHIARREAGLKQESPMKKLTAEFCEYLLKDLQRQSITGCGIGRTQECYLQALEIALPILEQQERGEGEWIDWVGGECPVADHVKVEYQLRGGAKGSDQARRLDWQHEGKRHDIIAYRIIPEQPTNQNGEQ